MERTELQMPCPLPSWLFLCLLPAINADFANAVPLSIVAVFVPTASDKRRPCKCLAPSHCGCFYLLPARVCRQVVARSFLSGALRPFHVCPSPQTGNGYAHSASRNVDRCSKMVCSPGDFRCFLVRLSNVHCPPGNVFLSTYQCLPVHLSMFSCPLINVSLCIYQCFFAHLSMFHHPFVLPLSSFLFASFMLIYFIY